MKQEQFAVNKEVASFFGFSEKDISLKIRELLKSLKVAQRKYLKIEIEDGKAILCTTDGNWDLKKSQKNIMELSRKRDVSAYYRPRTGKRPSLSEYELCW